MLKEKQEYEVLLVVERTHLIRTLSRTPAEAERDAEQLYEDGETGQLVDENITSLNSMGTVYEEDDLDEEEYDASDK